MSGILLGGHTGAHFLHWCPVRDGRAIMGDHHVMGDRAMDGRAIMDGRAMGGHHVMGGHSKEDIVDRHLRVDDLSLVDPSNQKDAKGGQKSS